MSIEVVLLSLGQGSSCDGACGTDGGCGGAACSAADPIGGVRVPVLACRDALRAAGATARIVEANSDAEIDQVLADTVLAGAASDGGVSDGGADDGGANDRGADGHGANRGGSKDGVADGGVADRHGADDGGAGDGDADRDGVHRDGASSGPPRLIVVGNGDGEPRAVLRRLVRRCAPPPSQRSTADLPAGRTVPDLPPIGLLPLTPSEDDLVARLGLPAKPAEVAAAVLAGHTTRYDLLRTDGGSVTLHGAMLGGADESARPVAWRAAVHVDDAVLSDGGEPLLVCAVVNAGGPGYASLDGLPLITRADPADGVLDVAVAVLAKSRRRLLRGRRPRIEVRRARGRAVAVSPVADDGVPFSDDAVSGTLARKRTWWMEAGAWAAYR